MVKNKGYVLIQRSIIDHWIWKDETPFTYRDAWIDLILMVNHEDNKIMINHNYITVQRGQHYTSVRKLAERWHWSKNRVRHFLQLLVCDGMCLTFKTGNGTLLTLVNYDKNQSWRDTNRYTNKDTDKYSDRDTDGYTDVTQTKNEIKNDIKNEKRMKKRSSAPNPILEPEEEEEAWQ